MTNNAFGYGPGGPSLSPVLGNLDVTGNLHVYGNTQLDGSLTTTGPTTLNGALTVNDPTQFNDTVQMNNGLLFVNNRLQYAGNVLGITYLLGQRGINPIPNGKTPANFSFAAGSLTVFISGSRVVIPQQGIYMISYNMNNFRLFTPPTVSGSCSIFVTYGAAGTSVIACDTCAGDVASIGTTDNMFGASTVWCGLLNQNDIIDFWFGMKQDGGNTMTAECSLDARIIKLF